LTIALSIAGRSRCLHAEHGFAIESISCEFAGT
jgi:hypothetical protein